MEIKVLGTGCSTCVELYQILAKKIVDLEIKATLKKIDDIMEIISLGVISTPAVMIDGKIVHTGGLPTEKEINSWFKKYSETV